MNKFSDVRPGPMIVKVTNPSALDAEKMFRILCTQGLLYSHEPIITKIRGFSRAKNRKIKFEDVFLLAEKMNATVELSINFKKMDLEELNAQLFTPKQWVIARKRAERIILEELEKEKTNYDISS